MINIFQIQLMLIFLFLFLCVPLSFSQENEISCGTPIQEIVLTSSPIWFFVIICGRSLRDVILRVPEFYRFLSNPADCVIEKQQGESLTSPCFLNPSTCTQAATPRCHFLYPTRFYTTTI